MLNPQKIVIELLESAGIKINGSNPCDIRIKDERFFARVLRDKNLGLGESYMDGWWECDRIDQLIHRLLAARLDRKIKDNLFQAFTLSAAVMFNRQNRRRSYEVAEQHYNLDNDLFFTFLDPYKQYSCAYFDGTNDLDRAQLRKLELICRKIELKASDQVLDIGCGWGGLGKYIAENYSCNVTGINISTEQISFAEKECRGLPVKFFHKDYRELDGRYDKIVSVGMFEHVGYKNYFRFMEAVCRCLKPQGIFLLHTIGRNDSHYCLDPWVEKYIFPNGMLPSMRQIARAMEGHFVMEDVHNLGPHYDITLTTWHRNFISAWKTLRVRYTERFKRMWEYYLLSCAGAFRARSIQLWQIVMTHAGARQPRCRSE